jgi:hypothetical protein
MSGPPEVHARSILLSPGRARTRPTAGAPLCSAPPRQAAPAPGPDRTGRHRRRPGSARNYTNWSTPTFVIGLDHNPPGISTDSARGWETGNNRHDSGKPDSRKGRPARRQGGPVRGLAAAITKGQRYRTSNPVTDRPMIIRWISDVPSKIVKILAVRAVYAGQRPADPVVSARIQHAPSEMNVGFGSARVRFRSWYERTPRRHPSTSGAAISSLLRSGYI